jgi:hypothetical protein
MVYCTTVVILNVSVMILLKRKMWMIRGSPRTPDRLPKLSDSHVLLSEVWETMIGTCGPYDSGGFVTKAFLEVLLTKFKDWRQPIIDSLNNIHLTDDEAGATRMAIRARSYTIVGGQLYKKGVVQPLLRCISQEEGKSLLAEIHSSVSGSHIGPRA